MKTLGFLGGMTYHSTALYYTLINSHIQRTLGGSASASMIMHSVNHAETAALFTAGRWDAVAERFITAAKHMRAAGAQGVAIGCNIGHKVAAEVETGSGLPVLHIADFTAEAVRRRGLDKIALLATRAAMEGDFIRGRLGVEVLVPGEEDRAAIDRAVFEELGAGIVTGETRAMMVRVVEGLVAQGVQAVVLACTDLQFVLKQEDVSVPLMDTMELHAKGLADWALDDEK
ncbi:aspartate racemase [Cryphonectria parasitica EP155]|uniref:Aspartate racemase n=1 Tax=Cryphonectria parasitica (strain ATCC 38755 / EP155) TaxID=660469 RepID=A0A9P4Y0T2_CRYP1|nr:aspartate racemase [Cryphonectria parasitica EP155]KAF3764292.1 aspartate racemase [Cryphonectria parasitica EP155]